MAGNTKRHALTDSERQRLRAHHRECSLSQKDLMKWFELTFRKKIAQSQVSEILSNKYEYLDASPATEGKRNRKSPYEILGSRLSDWSKTQDNYVSNKELKARGLMIWTEMKDRAPKAPTFSDGWLSKWRKDSQYRRTEETDEAAAHLDVRGPQVASISLQPNIPSPEVFLSSVGMAILRNSSYEVGIAPHHNFASSFIDQSGTSTGRITELQYPEDHMPLPSALATRPSAKNKKRKGVSYQLGGDWGAFRYEIAAVADLGKDLPSQELFDDETCNEILELARISAISPISTVYPAFGIMGVLAPMLNTIVRNLDFLQQLNILIGGIHTARFLERRMLQEAISWARESRSTLEYLQQHENRNQIIQKLRESLCLLKGAAQFGVHPKIQSIQSEQSEQPQPSSRPSYEQAMWLQGFSVDWPSDSSEENFFVGSDPGDSMTGDVVTPFRVRSADTTMTGGSLKIGGGRVDILSIVRRPKKSLRSSKIEMNGKTEATKIVITPPSYKRIPQVIVEWTNTYIMPCLSFRNLISPDSEIIRIASNGTLEEFQDAISRGIGSISDYDGKNSLAGHAALGDNFAVLDFLLPHVDMNAFDENSGRL